MMTTFRCHLGKPVKLHQLQALVASADAGGIRAAARVLGISQAAVTRALRELETEQHLPLFVRTPSGLTFTEYGKALLIHARLVLKQLEHAQVELDHLRGQASGRLCIGVTPWVALTFLSEAVQAFRERMPEVRLELFESLMAVAQPLLRDGSMDFAIGPLHGAQAAQEFACEKLLDYDTAVLVRQGHPLAGCGSIHELLEQDWALNYTGDGHDALMRELFWRHGALIDERRIVRAHSVAILQTLVEQADMCTWVPAIIGAAPPLLGRVVPLALRETFEQRRLGIITRRGGALSNPAQCFVECLLQVIRRHARSAKKDDRRLFETLRLLV